MPHAPVPPPRPLYDIGTHGGFTPLHYAAWSDRPEVVAALMQAGANLALRSWGWDKEADPLCL